MPKQEKKKCWYCGERPRTKRKGALFCSKCEKLGYKEVNRAEQENFYLKV